MLTRILAAATLSFTLVACNGTQTTAEPDDAMDAMMAETSVRWTWTQTGIGPDEIPQNEIRLVDEDGNEKHMVVCNGVPAQSDIEESDTAVRCWWAGGGNDYAVFETDAGLSVQTRWVDEESGFGEWEELIVIK